MEADRFQQSHGIFIVGLISLSIGLAGLLFAFYLCPVLLWGVNYDIPGFIIDWKYWLVTGHQFTEKGASWTVFTMIFAPSVIALIIADFCSNYIDNQIYHVTKPAEPSVEGGAKEGVFKKPGQGSGAYFFLKILLLIILVFIIARLLEWMIYIPPPDIS